MLDLFRADLSNTKPGLCNRRKTIELVQPHKKEGRGGQQNMNSSLLNLKGKAGAKHLTSNTTYNLQFGMKSYRSMTTFMVTQKTQKMSHATHTKTI
jgi:hypothetical protein